jgi:hypothetical protein
MRKILVIIAALLLLSVSYADARSSRGKVYGFRTGYCKTSSCYSKHSSGRYVHPLTRRKH